MTLFSLLEILTINKKFINNFLKIKNYQLKFLLILLLLMLISPQGFISLLITYIWHMTKWFTLLEVMNEIEENNE